MQKPTLVVMAAGMGSRFGGLKQVAPVDGNGNAIIDFSLYDAKRAGFEKVAFIIKHEIEADFRALVSESAAKQFDVSYVFQELDRLPPGFSVPVGRTKPWGTGHAVACCLDVVQGPFAVINADDFYGREAFEVIYEFLSGDRAKSEHAMVGYQLRNTLTENGYVSRGVCDIQGGYLRGVTERTSIKKSDGGAVYEDGGKTFFLNGFDTVSMNFWGFGSDMLSQLNARFPQFLEKALMEDPLKSEFFLPAAVGDVIDEGLGSVRMINCGAQWHGVTYREDLDSVKTAIAQMKKSGLYPDKLNKG